METWESPPHVIPADEMIGCCVSVHSVRQSVRILIIQGTIIFPYTILYVLVDIKGHHTQKN